jgi:hypothetical protein
MVTELLFEAYIKYIEPLLEFGWVHINDCGFIVERNEGKPIYYTNDRFKGLPGEVPQIYPVVPLNDEHYSMIKGNPGQEVFNPFRSFKYMQLVMMEFKRGLIATHLYDEESNSLSIEEQEELIRFYYEKSNGMYTAGFANVEDESTPKTLYTYTASDIIKATWGLCVTAYNDVDRKHNDYFYEIEKTWNKAKRLSDKWEQEKRNIIPKMKDIKQESVGFQHIDLSDNATNKVNEYNRNYYINDIDMDGFLLSLFNVNELELASEIEHNNPNDSPFQRKERIWQYPDFASDETIFSKSNKETEADDVIGAKKNIIDVTPIYNGDIITRQESNEFLRRDDDSIVKEVPISSIEETTEQASFQINDEQFKEDVNGPERTVAPDPPYEPIQSKSEDLPEEAGPHIMGQMTPPPPFGPFGNYDAGGYHYMQPQYPLYPYPMQSPVQPVGMGGMPFPMGPSMPPMGMVPGAMNGFGNPMMGMMPPMMNNMYPLQNIPQNIDQIDFESNDHPDPFSNYR